MKKLFPITMLFLMPVTFSFGQESDSAKKNEDAKSSIFADGIYLENINILIPWQTSFSSIENFGSPKIVKEKGHFVVRWDSVTILKDIVGNLYYYPKRIFTKEKYSSMTTVQITVDSINAIKLKHHLEATFGKSSETKYFKRNQMTQYSWFRKDCYLNFLQWKDFKNVNRLHVIKRVERQ